MTLGDVTEFLKALTAMDYVQFFSILAVIIIGFFVWLAKHKSHNDANVTIAKTQSTSDVVKVGIFSTALVVIAKIFK